MRAQHRAFEMRTAHPKQALLEQAAHASGAKAPPTPPAPHIAPLTEGFAIDAPVAPGPQTTQPASGRAKASKRPAPEGSTSTTIEEAPSSSRPVSSPQPDPPTFWDYGPPLTMFSGNPHRPPIGSHPHPYQRTSSAPSGKNTGKGKGTPTLKYADIANKGKKGQKGGKGQKGQKAQRDTKVTKGAKVPK